MNELSADFPSSEARQPTEAQIRKEERLAGYRDWLKTLDDQVQRGKITGGERNNKIARAMFARDLLIERFKTTALIDDLTKLPNAKAFRKKYYRDFAKRGETFGLLIMDADFFKRINDTYGHAVGNEVLVQIGLTLNTIFREEREGSNDFIGRIGGEEFGAILEGVKSQKDLFNIAERARLAFDGNPFLVTIGQEMQRIPVTISIGGGLFKGGDPREFFHSVDKKALYSAKEQGRNRVVMLSES